MKRLFEYIVTIVFLFLLFGGIVVNILTQGKFTVLGIIMGFEISIILFIVTKTVLSWVRKTFKN
jgi:hypothetical protein